MTKALTGDALDLGDEPAHGCDLFLVDGNNLAYRAYFALPEELATTEGQPTNALLGFANMLFKLLVDYKPRAVAVAWDTRPVARLQLATAGTAAAQEIALRYKSERKPMPPLLSEQFPYFRPIVEAFGYRNLEFEGWEADDVIATLATLADGASLKTCVVSTDRDAFQLVTKHVCLMMTPRGVSDVQVYTPERVEARYGIGPALIPDFIGLKGDTSDNIPGVPGIGEKTAAQLLAKYGSLEAVIASASEMPPARGKSITESADQARAAKAMATSQRDLDLGCDPAALVQRPPDRSKMREMFRRFEFKALLKRVDLLDQALPAAEREAVGTEVRWERGELPNLSGKRVALAVQDGRFAAASDGGVIVGHFSDATRASLEGALLVAHDAKSLPATGAKLVDDTMIAAYLIEPARPGYIIDELASEQGVEVRPIPDVDAHTASLVRAAEAARRLAPRYREKLQEREQTALYESIELALVGVLARMEAVGVRVDAAQLIGVTSRISARVNELEARAHELAGAPFVLGSPKQLGQVLFEKLGLEPGRKTKTGYSTDTHVLKKLHDAHPIIPVISEWRELSTLLHTYLEALPGFVRGSDGRVHATIHQTSASTGRLSTSNPNLQAIPVRTELGRTIRAAFVASPGNVLLSADYSQVELRLLAHVSGEPRLVDAFARGDDIHAATAAEVFGKAVTDVTDSERTMAKRVNFGILYGISAFGLSEDLDIPREEAKNMIDAYLARLPGVQGFIARTIEDAKKTGYVTTLFGRRRPVPEIRATNRQTQALGERLAVNSVIQGSAADVIKVAMIAIDRRLGAEARAARLVLQVHDELLFDVPEAELDAVRAMVVEEMTGAFKGEPSLVVDATVGPHW